MKRRRRHGLDLLPLLDVFMVVLFVFATIQEGQLGDEAAAAAARERELAAMRAQAPGAAAELGRLRDEQAATTAALRAAEARLADAEAGRAELQQAVEAVREAAEAAARTGATAGDEALRRQEVLSKLLDHFSVFEIEIGGAPGEAGMVNHCCYRSEPVAGAWRACGEVPATTVGLEEWLATGGSGLVEALRRTRGGNALTVVRQNERATWGVGRKLEEQLRGRFPDHKIYAERVALHALACPR